METVTSVAVFCFMMNFSKPTFLIDPQICRSNIRSMAGKAASSGAIFRPHFKTHQSLAIGKWFRQEGISRITTSSLSAAHYFTGDGWDDITVAFPVNLREMDLINELAGRIRLGLLVEDPEVVRALQEKLTAGVDAYIKIDTGYHRTGLMLEEMPVISNIADLIRQNPLTRLKGLLTHAGHTYHAKDLPEIRSIFGDSLTILESISTRLGESELLLSYGDTPSCSLLDDLTGIGELRPGNFVFYDLMQWKAGVCSFNQIGGIVVCPVVAVHTARNQAVLYGGAVHLSKDSISVDDRPVFGQLVTFDGKGWSEPVPGAFVVSLSQEHGILEASAEVIGTLEPGMLAGIIPVHSCLTARLLQGYSLIGGGEADYFPG
jgi:D-serine deaminase-like pyridoxal phosphate-dependent protein